VISDRDIWTAALTMAKRYGDDAMLEASERADQLLDDGDMVGAETPVRACSVLRGEVAGASPSMMTPTRPEAHPRPASLTFLRSLASTHEELLPPAIVTSAGKSWRFPCSNGH
jgi:hypothetical protein